MSYPVIVKDIHSCLQQHPWFLSMIEQTEELCWIALKANSHNIQAIEHPNHDMLMYAVKNCSVLPSCFCLFEQTDEIKWAIVNSKHTRNFRLVKEPTEEMIFVAIKKNPRNIASVKNPTDEMMELAIRLDPYAIGNLKNTPEHIRLLAVSLNGSVLHVIEDQTEEICLVAVSNPIQKPDNRFYATRSPVVMAVKELTEKVRNAALTNPRATSFSSEF